MKDKIFKFIDKLNEWVYKKVVKITYLYLTNKKTKNLKHLTKEEKRRINLFWKKEFGKKIPLNEFKWYKSKFGYIDEKLIPDTVWHTYIEPFFCNVKLEKAFQDKNYFDTIIEPENCPKTIFRCINYQLLDKNYNLINNKDCIKLSNNFNEIIIKPSLESGGGRNIMFVSTNDLNEQKLEKIIKDYSGNFIVQQIIKQSSFTEKFNKTSINTFRVLSFLHNGEVTILSCFFRVGDKNSRLDNVSSGGFLIPVTSDGIIQKEYYTKNKQKDLEKNNKDNFEFISENKKIKDWEKIEKVIKKYHAKLAHFKIINWDICLDNNDTPIIIEYNLIDSSVSSHQISKGPIFSDKTSIILNEIKNGEKL